MFINVVIQNYLFILFIYLYRPILSIGNSTYNNESRLDDLPGGILWFAL